MPTSAIDRPADLRHLPDEPGPCRWAEVLAPKGRVAFELEQGETLRIVDLDGQQVADFICFDKNNMADKISHSTTVMLKGNINLTTGDYIYSVDAWRMLEITRDTVGRHDILAGSCCPGLNRMRYGSEAEHQPNCRENLAAVMAPYGVKLTEIPYTFNIFMNVPVGPNGDIGVIAPISKPGDSIDLKAERDLVVAISNCPQERNVCNGFKATRLGLLIYAGQPS
ncbi:urea carboxylase-associated family protein [Lichenifustis flavocetrariae]|uniref:Urea carboxylase-associated family protein n=1 Tax=Lichenifustis flavocetrariae TaxID=2949735 RepID=A0AA41Z7M6_9HYPH|nr:urea carboxylase-associated family protein [Lichenifustis flavocetrariae]MCW6511815.1 urea carboxylase-associated family protein [Lichenifustis flavocetrariae]